MKRNDWRLLAGCAGLLLVLLVGRGRAGPAAFTPWPESQGLAFSVSPGDPLTTSGIHPADVLGAGGVVSLGCESLGLLCDDETSGAQDDLIALSFGTDFQGGELPGLLFSAGRGALGKAGSALAGEAGCSPAEVSGDAFEGLLEGGNQQHLDGDGQACSSGGGFPLGLDESLAGDRLDALADDPCLTVDPDCNGTPDGAIFAVLAPGSPSLLLLGAGGDDILLLNAEYLPVVWADGQLDLGLVSSDVIDGLCLEEDGDGAFSAGDRLLLSLRSGSPSLANIQARPGDVLRAAPLRVVYRGAALALADADELSALTCAMVWSFSDVFLPEVMRR